MAGLTPGPEDAEKQDDGAANLARSTHSRNTNPANVLARGAEPVVPIRTRREETAMKDTQKSARSTTATDKKFEGFTDEERGAMKERAQELKAAARRGPRAAKADGAIGGEWW